MTTPGKLVEGAPLAPLTTFEVGGPAHFLTSCSDAGELRQALTWARCRSLKVFLLGGGSNTLVADEGFDGLVIQLTDRHLELRRNGEEVLLEAGAGLPWDDLVARAVTEGLAGVEALSGIPGLTGAAPIQNIGAYGQELSETLESVEVMELASGEVSALPAAACELGYRSSVFKTRLAGSFAVTALTLRLRPEGAGAVRYQDLAERLGVDRGRGHAPSPREVRAAVLEIRREKAMLLDRDDPNRRSAGSFFLNPTLPSELAEEVRRRVAELRGEEAAGSMPAFPAGPGRTKLSAAWLIEAAGFHKGYRLGGAGLSTRHVLALVNRGGASARDLLTLAGRIRRRVREAFGVELQ
ncbi:MAG: UDP-N-acetylmuramate dehydrogenase, partial [Acidobacteria bacterium]|nr:UDP-N-acetylmuramate dehydrogenase [Acidobacteriota bacterium]